MNESWDILKALSDPTRLRLLALLAREELSVAELQEILGMGQSRISSQLALLRTVNLVSDRREGKNAFYSIRPGLPARTQALTRAALDAVTDLPLLAEDRDNLDRILQKRRRTQEQYFNLIAGRLGRNYCPGRSWEAIGHLALRLTPAIDIADLGAGEGLVSQLLARRARQVWCIDNSPRMVEVGSELARKNGLANLAYRLGDIEQVPLGDGSVDLAILSQALHHAGTRRRRSMRLGASSGPAGSSSSSTSTSTPSPRRASSTPTAGSASRRARCTASCARRASPRSRSPPSRARRSSRASRRCSPAASRNARAEVAAGVQPRTWPAPSTIHL